MACCIANSQNFAVSSWVRGGYICNSNVRVEARVAATKPSMRPFLADKLGGDVLTVKLSVAHMLRDCLPTSTESLSILSVECCRVLIMGPVC